MNLPFDDFCAAIKMPQWESREKIKERSRPLMDLYEASQMIVVKFEVFISHLFDILPILLPSVFLLGRLQTNYLLIIYL
jgi:hypothetical protein